MNCGWLLCLVPGLFLLASAQGCHAKSKPEQVPSQSSSVAIVATVNGEAITDGELQAGLPKGLFGSSAGNLRQNKLERLIVARALHQFVAKEKMEPDAADIDAAIEELRQTPPQAGSCMCCRYASLDQYMIVNGYDMAELRQEVSNNRGIEKYLNAQWVTQFQTPEARQSLIEAERAGVAAHYVKVSHIFFNTFQNPALMQGNVTEQDMERILRNARRKGQEALKRVKSGETFEAVAKEVSGDAVSRAQGGSLGCISPDVFGHTFASAVAGLKPGEISTLVETPWGIHIIRRGEITDDDVFDVLKNVCTARLWNETRLSIIRSAKVERMKGR